MNISIYINNPQWVPVFTIQKGTILNRGRSNTRKEIRSAAALIQNNFICYSWGLAETLFYVGSVAKPYRRGGYKSSLEGRVHNYLTNHQTKGNGRINTNLMVFNNICQKLQECDVTLSILKFDTLKLGDQSFSFEEYSNNPDLIHAVEQLLICSYNNNGGALWNRTSHMPDVVTNEEPINPPNNDHQINHHQVINHRLGEQIKYYIAEQVIKPHFQTNNDPIRIRAGDIHQAMNLDNRMPSVCGVLDNADFIHQFELECISRSGPLRGANAVWIFRK